VRCKHTSTAPGGSWLFSGRIALGSSPVAAMSRALVTQQTKRTVTMILVSCPLSSGPEVATRRYQACCGAERGQRHGAKRPRKIATQSEVSGTVAAVDCPPDIERAPGPELT
jgi:hypothetical protein